MARLFTRSFILGMARLLSLFFTLIGVACLCVAVGCVVQTQLFLRSAQAAQGAVVKVVWSGDTDGGYAPKVRYTVRGRAYELQSPFSTNPSAYSVGQSVNVVYSRTAPEQGRIDVWWQNYFLAIISGAVGSVFIAMGVMGEGSVRRAARLTQELET